MPVSEPGTGDPDGYLPARWCHGWLGELGAPPPVLRSPALGDIPHVKTPAQSPGERIKCCSPGSVRLDALAGFAGQHVLEFHETPEALEWHASEPRYSGRNGL